MKLFRLILVAGVALALYGSPANAVLIAHWNFNSGNSGTASDEWPGPIAASSGSGSIDMSGWAGTTEDFAGSTINAVGADASGASLSLVNLSGNGTFIQVEFSMAGLTDLMVSFATRGTGTGFNAGQWAWSNDGASFTDIGGNTATTSTSFGLASVDMSAADAIEGDATVFLRYTLDGATTASGNNRIDNLQLNAVPEPATLALFAAGGCALLMRRRK